MLVKTKDDQGNWMCGCYLDRCGCHTAYANIKRIAHFDLNDLDCEECGAFSGGFHHYGCSKEICPKCGNPLTSQKCKCGIYVEYQPLLGD